MTKSCVLLTGTLTDFTHLSQAGETHPDRRAEPQIDCRSSWDFTFSTVISVLKSRSNEVSKVLPISPEEHTQRTQQIAE